MIAKTAIQKKKYKTEKTPHDQKTKGAQNII